MDDRENKVELDRLLHQANGPDLEELENAVQIARTIVDGEGRGWYLSEIAKSLATIKEWDKSIEVARSVHLALEKKDALLGITSNLVTANQHERALAILAEAEVTAYEIEGEGYRKWQKAQALDQIANLYERAGEGAHAKRVWAKAIEAAQSGQESSDIQDIVDCSGVLAEIARHLASAGYFEDAKQAAQAIRGYKREGTLREIARMASEGSRTNPDK